MREYREDRRFPASTGRGDAHGWRLNGHGGHSNNRGGRFEGRGNSDDRAGRFNGHRGRNGLPGEDGDFQTMPHRPGDGGGFQTMPYHPGEDGDFQTMPHRPGEGGDFQTMPRHPGEDGGFQIMPHHPGEGDYEVVPEGGSPYRFGPRGDAPGFPPRNGGPGHGGPHGGRPHRRGPDFGDPDPGDPNFGDPGFGLSGRPGFPPHRPDPEALRGRIEEGNLTELIAMAGRMLRHRPGADPARGQNLVLSILAGREALSQRELQQMLGVQPGSLSEILTKLEHKGLLVRERAEDRRGNTLRITDGGRQAVAAPRENPDDALFAALTAEEQAQLRATLQKLLLDWADKADRGPRRGGSGPALPPGNPGGMVNV